MRKRESNKKPIEDREEKTAKRNAVRRRVSWEHSQPSERRKDVKFKLHKANFQYHWHFEDASLFMF